MEADHSAFEEYFKHLYEENYNPVMRFLGRLLVDYHRREEVTQETFYRIYKGRIRLSHNLEQRRNYLFTVARNIVADISRREKVENNHLLEIFYREVILDDTFCSELEEAVLEGEVMETLYGAISESPREKRELFLDLTFRGELMKDLSEKKNISFYKIKKIQREVHDLIYERVKPLWQDGPTASQV